MAEQEPPQNLAVAEALQLPLKAPQEAEEPPKEQTPLQEPLLAQEPRQEPQPPQEAEQQTEVQAQRTLDSPEELVLTPEPIYKKPPTGKSR